MKGVAGKISSTAGVALGAAGIATETADGGDGRTSAVAGDDLFGRRKNPRQPATLAPMRIVVTFMLAIVKS